MRVRFLGGGHGSPLQSSCLENPMDRGAWGYAKSRTQLSDKRFHFASSLLAPSLGAWRQGKGEKS